MTEKLNWREDPPNSGANTYVGSRGDVIVALVSRNLTPVPNNQWVAYRCTPEEIIPIYQESNRGIVQSFEQLTDAQVAIETLINSQQG
jgi:hypothetical protein